MDKLIYLDNNATTMMPDIVTGTIIRWFNKGNPSAEYKLAKESKTMIDNARNFIAKTLNFSLSDYKVIFNSGASEGNCHVIVTAVRAYKSALGKIPHIITSNSEHKSILDCVNDLVKEKAITLTLLTTTKGAVKPSDLAAAIRPDTALISIMFANNETGIINDIAALVKIAHAKKIPFHTDAVQAIGKITVDLSPAAFPVDALTMSFHKIHGPPGIGMCIIKNEFIEGYHLCPLVCGSQNFHLRGGTENVPYVAGAFASMKYVFTDDFSDKCKKMAAMRSYIVNTLNKRFFCFYVENIDRSDARAAIANATYKTPCLFWIANPKFANSIPNTILVSVVKPKVCNKAIRKGLEHYGAIVSLGSACNTASKEMSPTLKSMKIKPILADGIIRISLSEENTMAECVKFVDIFTELIKSKSIERSSA